MKSAYEMPSCSPISGSGVVHTWLSMAYAVVAIILFALMLYMARAAGLRN